MVTIVIPSYNYGHYLRESIQSALDQTVKCEVIVVDDGSTDNTREICKEYPVKYIYQENKGLSAARNTGIRAAKGEYIVPLDADDALDPTFVEETLALMPSIARTGLKTIEDTMVILTPSPHTSKEDFKVNNQIFVTSMYPKWAWEKVGGYDEEMRAFEDWDFWIRMIEHLEIKTIEKPLFMYRIHRDSMTGKMTDKDREELKDYLRKKYKWNTAD